MLSEEVLDELDALHAIFADDFVNCEKVWNYPSFLIKVRPTSSQRVVTDISASVKFTLTKTYPKTPPKIEIESIEGISNSAQHELLKYAKVRANELLGNPMIHDILTSCQELLEKNVENNKSFNFYDKMNEREKKQEEILVKLRSASIIDDVPTKVDAKKSVNNTYASKLLGNVSILKKPLIDDSSSEEEDESEDYHIEIETKSCSDKLNKQKQPENFNEILDKTVKEDFDDDEDEFDDNLQNSKSRYQSEFIAIELLGKGSGGEVWKVKHRLDRRFYAVKRIKLDKNNELLNHKLKREVTTISRLFHKNVVRYYAAWIENEYSDHTIHKSNDDDSESESGSESNSRSKSKSSSNNKNISMSEDFRISTNNEKIVDSFEFEYDDEDDDSEDEYDSESDDNNSGSDSDETLTLNDTKVITQIPASSNVSIIRYLYIQMEYCPKTLRDIIKSNDIFNQTSEIFSLFRQIVEGLQYIHSKSMLHRVSSSFIYFIN